MRRLYYVSEDASVSDAVKVMEENRVGSVLAVRDGTPVGILTDKDVLFKVVSEGRNPAKVRVSEVMSSPLITVRKDEPVEKALELMGKHDIRRVLVVDEEGRPYGLLVEKHIVGDLLGGSVRVKESGVEARSWLERHIIEVTEEALERFRKHHPEIEEV